MENKYKVKKLSEMKPAWWGLVVQSINTAIEKSGEVLIKLPLIIQSVDDVPQEWKDDYLANEPFLTEKEATAVIHAWYPGDDAWQ